MKMENVKVRRECFDEALDIIPRVLADVEHAICFEAAGAWAVVPNLYRMTVRTETLSKRPPDVANVTWGVENLQNFSSESCLHS